MYLFRFTLLLAIAIILFQHSCLNAAESWSTKHPFKTAVFIENKGQFNGWGKTNKPVLFGIDNMDQVQFTTDEIIYHLRKIKAAEEREDENNGEEEKAIITDSWVKAKWLNANPNTKIESDNSQEGYFTYCLYSTDMKTICGISAVGYKKIIYRDLYPGIDVEIIIPEVGGGIKYSINCKAGADISQVKISYENDIDEMHIANDAVIINTPAGILTDHRPECFYKNGTPVPSEFILNKNKVSFNFPSGRIETNDLIIDPWVTSDLSNLSYSNEGFDVDLDYQKNLYVYGGGDASGSGSTGYKVAKYDPLGNLQWTFNGALPSVPWNSVGDMYACPSNFLVEKSTGRCYVGQTFVTAGTQVIRLTTNGIYDNFISTINTDMPEIWDMAFNCTNGQIYACGGGMTTNNNFGIIDPQTSTVTISNITGYQGGHQDIVTAAMDNNGSMYAILASISVTQVHNCLFKVNSTFNGNEWKSFTGYSTLWEPNNKSYLNFSGVTGNGSNVICVNDSYVFYYDGNYLAAYSKMNGSPVGTMTVVDNNYTQMYQTGIAADNCNNVYIGGKGVIHIYSFNGNKFTAEGRISLGATNSLAAVHDIKYDWNSNSLYVSGSDFAGIYSASQSTSCNNLDLSVNTDCAGKSVVSVSTSLTGGLLIYTWKDSLGNIIRNRSTSSLSDSLTGLPDGLYYVEVQLSPRCGGPSAIDTVHIVTRTPMALNIIANDPLCFGNANANATVFLSDTSGFHFLWSTTPTQLNQTAIGLRSGFYTCMVTDSDGCISSASIQINDPLPLNCSVSGGATVCPGDEIILTALAGGGTGNLHFHWSTGESSSNIRAHPFIETVYSCTTTDDNGCTAASFATVKIHAPPLADGGPDVIECSGESQLIGIASVPGFNYEWFPNYGLNNPHSSQTPAALINQTNSTVANIYNLIVTDQFGCKDTDQVNLNVKPIPDAFFERPENQCLNDSGFVFIPHSSTIGNVEYTWNFGIDATPSTSNLIYPPPVKYQTIGPHFISVHATYEGCNGPPYSDSVFVNVSPAADFQNDIYSGCAPLTVSFENMSSTNSQGYFWTFDDGTISDLSSPTHVFTSGGIYSISLSAISREGCVNALRKNKLITVYPKPRADFIYSPGKSNLLAPSFNFLNTSVDAGIYSWDFGDGSTSNEFDVWHLYTDTGTYKVILAVASNFGCLDTTETLIKLEASFTFYIPNAFSPNGDRKNDSFQGFGTLLKSYEMIIMNRWGKEIYWTNDYDKPWDGTDDSPDQSDVYIYKFRVSDVFDNYYDYIGRVSLIR